MRRLLSILFCVAALSACDFGQPVKVAYLGGMTGRYADLGQAGRNGAQFAVEQWNSRGGMNGRPLELLLRDDAHDAEAAARMARELVAAGVSGVVGPMTSAMAEAVVPVVASAGLPTISPTVTALPFYDRDDSFFLIMPSAVQQGKAAAEYQFAANNLRRVAAIYDLRNRIFTENWLDGFSEYLVARGGAVQRLAFDPPALPDYSALARQALAENPQAVLLLTSAVDTARLAQQIRQRRPDMILVAPMWAATEQVIELGGRAVEGVFFHQNFNRDSAVPRYQSFRKAFVERFRQEPGFAGVAGFDAMQALLEAMARRRSGQTLKESLLSNGPFTGAQDDFSFDAQGDGQRPQHVVTVQNGRFVVLE